MLAALHQRARVICFLLIFAAAAAYFVFGQLDFNHDSAVYILLTQSLISGEGYRSFYILVSPPHTELSSRLPIAAGAYSLPLRVELLGHEAFVAMVGVAALYVIYTFFRA